MASRRKEFFPEVTDEQWNDWHWQVKNRIETLDQLKKYIRLTPDEEEGIRARRQRFSRTGINSSVSGPGVVPDHRYVFDVLPALYPAPLCRTSRLCHSIGKNR